jgi:hypothetical protein
LIRRELKLKKQRPRVCVAESLIVKQQQVQTEYM